MSDHTTPTSGDEKAAAAGFVAFLALMAGGAGVVIAAIAIGVEHAWSRRPGANPDDRAATRARSAADHRAWLDHDAQKHAAWRRARRDWWTAGARGDPPTQPSAGSRFWSWLQRQWHQSAVAAGDLRDGTADGWRAANQTRRDGGTFGDIIRSRPDHPCMHCVQCGQPLHPNDAMGTSNAAVTYLCPRCGTFVNDHRGATGRSNEDPAAPTTPTPQPQTADPLNINPRINSQATTPNSTTPPATQPTEEPMHPTATDLTAATAPAALASDETNAHVAGRMLDDVQGTLTQITELTDALAAAAAKLKAQAEAASEHAQATGQPTATKQAADAAAGVATAIVAGVSAVSGQTVDAVDNAQAAQAGLAAPIDAHDQLTSAGADGRAVAAAANA